MGSLLPKEGSQIWENKKEQTLSRSFRQLSTGLLKCKGLGSEQKNFTSRAQKQIPFSRSSHRP